ncbi:MAG: PDZ domain-containing protein, partial [Candidatus Sungiibacteriota bacterium]
MKRTLVFMLALVAILTWLVSPTHTPYVFAAEKDYIQAQKAMLNKDLNGFSDTIRKEVTSLVAPLDNVGPMVGIGIQFRLIQQADGKPVAVVVSVIKGKPAEKAGMLKGDKILTVNGNPLAASTDYDASTAALIAKIRGDGKAGRLVTFEVDRNGTKMIMAVATAVLRSDKTAEAKKMREAIEKESAAH